VPHAVLKKLKVYHAPSATLNGQDLAIKVLNYSIYLLYCTSTHTHAHAPSSALNGQDFAIKVLDLLALLEKYSSTNTDAAALAAIPTWRGVKAVSKSLYCTCFASTKGQILTMLASQSKWHAVKAVNKSRRYVGVAKDLPKEPREVQKKSCACGLKLVRP
jgi:hypothetical protein